MKWDEIHRFSIVGMFSISRTGIYKNVYNLIHISNICLWSLHNFVALGMDEHSNYVCIFFNPSAFCRMSGSQAYLAISCNYQKLCGLVARNNWIFAGRLKIAALFSATQRVAGKLSCEPQPPVPMYQQSFVFLYMYNICVVSKTAECQQRGEGTDLFPELCSVSWKANTLLCFKTHCGRVTQICVGKLTTISSNNGLSPGAIFWTNAGILWIGPLKMVYSSKCIWKYRLRNGGHFVLVSMCQGTIYFILMA